MSSVSSFTPREFMLHYQADAIKAVTIANFGRDKFGGLNSVVLRAGTVLAFATNSNCYTPIYGAEVATQAAIGSNVVYVNCATQFAVGDNVKIGKPGHQNIIDAVEQDLGAVLSVYTTSKTLTVTADTKIISALVTGDYVFVEPTTADGTADAVAILHQDVKVVNDEGTAIDVEARIVQAGFVKTKQLLALTARAKLQLAGLGTASPGASFRFDDNAS
jgi:hypothetical protein